MLYELPTAHNYSHPDPFAVHEGPSYYDPNFLDDLHDFLGRRIERLNPRTESPEYVELEKRAARLFEELARALPTEEAKKMLLEYSDTLGALHYHEVRMISERVFYDGMRLMMRVMEGDHEG
jgi:hypothetical protein